MKSIQEYLDKYYPPTNELFWISNILGELVEEDKLSFWDMNNLAKDLVDMELKDSQDVCVNLNHLLDCIKENHNKQLFAYDECSTPKDQAIQKAYNRITNHKIKISYGYLEGRNGDGI